MAARGAYVLAGVRALQLSQRRYLLLLLLFRSQERGDQEFIQALPHPETTFSMAKLREEHTQSRRGSPALLY